MSIDTKDPMLRIVVPEAPMPLDRPRPVVRLYGRMGPWLRVLIVGLSCIVMATPLLWMLDTSLMGSKALYSTQLHVLPFPASTAGFTGLFNLLDYGRDFLNSAIVTGAEMLLVLAIGACGAYAFSQLAWRGRDALFVAYVVTIAIPPWTLLISQFLLVKSLGWLNSYEGLIVPPMAIALPLVTFLLRQFMKTLPPELSEAARVDGASRLRTLWTVLLPNMAPGLLTAGVLAFLQFWNNLLWPLLVVSTTNMDTVPLGLTRLAVTGTGWGLNVYWGPLMAGTLLAASPTILIFVFGQRRFIQGLTAGVRR